MHIGEFADTTQLFAFVIHIPLFFYVVAKGEHIKGPDRDNGTVCCVVVTVAAVVVRVLLCKFLKR